MRVEKATSEVVFSLLAFSCEWKFGAPLSVVFNILSSFLKCRSLTVNVLFLSIGKPCQWREFTLDLNAQTHTMKGAQWLSGRVLDSRPKGRGFEPHRRHCVVSLSKNINPSLVLVQLRRTCPFIAERLLMGRKESNQTKKLQLIQEGLLSLTSESMCRKYWLAA